jgi:CHAT domain-containing protein
MVDPSRSRLLLHDHDTAPLTVAELAPVRLERAQLAYLSACRTAFGASRLLDESVHLASAFLLAGFPHVIAASWEIADFLAPSVAADFYARLTDRAGAGRLDTDHAAEALHHTVRALRTRYPDRPALWAAYLHVGALGGPPGRDRRMPAPLPPSVGAALVAFLALSVAADILVSDVDARGRTEAPNGRPAEQAR